MCVCVCVCVCVCSFTWLWVHYDPRRTTKVNDDPRRNEKVSNDPNTHSHVMMIAFIQRYSPLSSRLTAHRLTSPLEHSQDLKRVLTNGIRRSP